MKMRIVFCVLVLSLVMVGFSLGVAAEEDVVFGTSIKGYNVVFDKTGAVLVSDEDGQMLFDIVLMYQGIDNAPHVNYDSIHRSQTRDGKSSTQISDNEFRVEGMRDSYVDNSREGKEKLKTKDISYACTFKLLEDGFDVIIEMKTKTPIFFNTFGPVIAFNHEVYIGSYLDIDGNEVYFHDDVRGGTYGSSAIQRIKVLKHNCTIFLDEPLPGTIDDNRQWNLPHFFTKLRFVEGKDTEPDKVYSRAISVRF